MNRGKFLFSTIFYLIRVEKKCDCIDSLNWQFVLRSVRSPRNNCKHIELTINTEKKMIKVLYWKFNFNYNHFI